MAGMVSRSRRHARRRPRAAPTAEANIRRALTTTIVPRIQPAKSTTAASSRSTTIATRPGTLMPTQPPATGVVLWHAILVIGDGGGRHALDAGHGMLLVTSARVRGS
jgi:hypothetical protein